MAQLTQFQQLMARQSSMAPSTPALCAPEPPVLSYSHCFATCSVCEVYETRYFGYSKKRRFTFRYRFLVIGRSLEASASLAGSSALQPANEATI